MEVSRRGVLKASALVGAGLLLPLRLPATANAFTATGITPFTEKLPTLGDLGVINATGGGSANISMVSAFTHKFHVNMKATPTFAYRNLDPAVLGPKDYLGPVIVAKRDVPFTLNVTNDLGIHPLADSIDMTIMGTADADKTAPRAAVHLHGGNTDPANDGDPLDSFGVGTTKPYTYENTQEAAGLWYHDHALGITRLNVLAGLASGYLVRDQNDPGDGSTGLPPAPDLTTLAHNYEVPLILQDRSFNADGSFAYEPAPWIPEFFGNVATVNGKAFPNLAVDKGKYRFRVFNGSNARFYNLRFMYGATALTFFQIGTDGGLLDSPVALKTLLISPGERADLVVDFAGLVTGAKVILTNNAVTPYPSGPRARRDGGSPLPQIMRFTVNTAKGWTTALPATLRKPAGTGPGASTGLITRLAGLAVDKSRNMALVEVHDSLGNPTMVVMNNEPFMAMDGSMPMMDPLYSNTLEEWTLINTTVDAHPMHLHFAQFQIINREKFTPTTATGQDSVEAYAVQAGYLDPVTLQSTGAGSKATIFPPPDVTPYLDGVRRKPLANEMGWKDTIVVMPGEVTRIRIPFGPDAVPDPSKSGSYLPMAIGKAHTGPYVSHCHILEHEENDMMMRFNIDPKPAV